ncbi:MAG: hypothetical protein U9P71_07830 [Campylobacterota bacterium]|nr:hypothetical protein [Campylobacterota bacterium]
MNKMLKQLLVVLALTMFGATASYADAAKGQKVYLKKFKSKFELNGAKFAALHSQDEWETLFADDAAGFIKEFSEKYPKSADYLNKPKTLKRINLLKDFCIEYANDSGNVPSC